jgi:hypothetical protein
LKKIDLLLQKCRSISLFYRKTMLSGEDFEKQKEKIIDSENRLIFVLIEISQLEKVLQHSPECGRLPGGSKSGSKRNIKC